MPSASQPRGNLVADTTRRPSRSIWADDQGKLGPLDIIEDPSIGWHYYDDFRDLPLAPTLTTQIAFGKYKAFGTASTTLKGESTINSVEQPASVLTGTFAADNDGISIAQAYPGALLSGLTTNSGKLWFEVSVAVSTILVNTIGFLTGLAETEQFTLASAVPLNASDSITSGGSIIGFRKGEDALGVIDTVVSDRATSFTNILASAGTISAAYTFYKLGMIYDPAESTKCLRFFFDGVESTTAYSKTSLVANTNLDANALGWIFAAVGDSAVAGAKFFVRWVRMAQLYPGSTTL